VRDRAAWALSGLRSIRKRLRIYNGTRVSVSRSWKRPVVLNRSSVAVSLSVAYFTLFGIVFAGSGFAFRRNAHHAIVKLVTAGAASGSRLTLSSAPI